MSVKVHKGSRWVMRHFPKKASTAFVKGEFVELSGGFVQPCTSSTAEILGINQDNEIASSDATTDLIGVWVPVGKAAELIATQTAATTVGSEYDLSDHDTVNQGASSTDAVTCVKSLSSTEGVFVINKPQLA